MSVVIYSSSLVAAFLGGILALFAPCCIVSLLPAYIGSAIGRHRLGLPLTTGLFALGIAVVMLPIVLGIGLLGQVLSAYHSEVSFVVGAFLLGLGGLIISGRTMDLPIPTLNLRVRGNGAGAVVLLGVSSGLASACCAPVFAGVVAITALGGSVGGSLLLAAAYIFGMVFPLLVIALFWQVLDLEDRWRAVMRLPRIRLFGRRLAWTDLLSGTIFLLMGTLAIGLALSGQQTLTPPWLASWDGWAQDVAGQASAFAGAIPWWAQLAVLALVGLVLVSSFVVTRVRRAPSPAGNGRYPGGVS
jgi:cytochrome c-type biogenesis protein